MEGPSTVNIRRLVCAFIMVSIWDMRCVFPMFGAEAFKDPMDKSKDSDDRCKGEVDLIAVVPIDGNCSSRPDETPGEVDWPEEQ